MDPDDKRRVDAYLASQNYFQGVAEEVATRILVAWLERNVPLVLARIRRAAINTWEWFRDTFGF